MVDPVLHTQPTSTAVGLLAVVVMVAANAFFVAAEFALVGARRTRLDEMARAGSRGAMLARRAVQSLDRYISSTQLGITLASLGLGWIGEPALAHVVEALFAWLPRGIAMLATHTVASGVAFAVITVLHIVLGELMPKALALLYPEMVSARVAAPLLAFSWLMAGPIAVLNGTANFLLRLLGLQSRGDHERLHSPEEIRMLVEQSQAGGSLNTKDARLLEGVFEFSEKCAFDVMTPRTEMVALAADLSVCEAADLAAATGLSRYPVWTGSVDTIVGLVHTKDVLAALRRDATTKVSEIMRQPLFVPGTKEVEDVLVDMKRHKIHLAIVLDEYGGTDGLVTMEDLLEEIVGPIFDEHDPVDRPPPAPEESGGGRLFDGAMAISDFNAANGSALPDRNYTTLGGCVFGAIGRLPAVGDRVTVEGLTFEVAAMEGNRVTAVRLVSPARDEL